MSLECQMKSWASLILKAQAVGTFSIPTCETAGSTITGVVVNSGVFNPDLLKCR